MLAIIGGSSLNELPHVKITRRQVVRTPYGEPSCGLTFGDINGLEVVFLARHGYAHTLQPHEINYRANIWALAEQKVSRIISVGSVGGIRKDLKPGTLVVPDQLIDYTYGRANTYFEGSLQPVQHVDFTDPYTPDARSCILLAARRQGIPVIDGGTYACTQGPRLETAAEVRRLEGDGADMVGMTGMPEAVLARELGVPYATICLVGNYAAGKGENKHHIDIGAATQILDDHMQQVLSIVGAICADEFCALSGSAAAVAE